MSRVLIVEDSRSIAQGIRTSLEVEGYRVDIANDGETGLSKALGSPPDLIILDLMLPRLDGYGVLRAIRGGGLDTPVLILSARGEEAEKVRGFRIGADDYVTKPFGLLELMARVDALCRRVAREGKRRGEEVIRFGDVEIQPSSHTVLRSGAPVSLRPRELELLLALARRNGAVVSRSRLLEEVWKYQPEVVTRTIDAHVAELRRKLEVDPARPRHILTVRKTGYRLAK